MEEFDLNSLFPPIIKDPTNQKIHLMNFFDKLPREIRDFINYHKDPISVYDAEIKFKKDKK